MLSTKVVCIRTTLSSGMTEIKDHMVRFAEAVRGNRDPILEECDQPIGHDGDAPPLSARSFK